MIMSEDNGVERERQQSQNLVAEQGKGRKNKKTKKRNITNQTRFFCFFFFLNCFIFKLIWYTVI